MIDSISSASAHYDEDYFAWQREVGAFGGWADLSKFEPFVKPSDHVLDFGCGGGYLLRALPGSQKIGIEINEVARSEAQSQGSDVRGGTDEVEDEWADVIVSNHALEHCPNPLGELQALLPKLRHGGTIVFVVPCESVHRAYDPESPDYHLFTWAPINLGNLFTEAGFQVVEAKGLIKRWPPFHRHVAKLGRPIFDLASTIYGRLRPSLSEVRVVARRP